MVRHVVCGTALRSEPSVRPQSSECGRHQLWDLPPIPTASGLVRRSVRPLVRVLGYDFLHASAGAKLLNTASNLAAILLFAYKGHVWWHFVLAMAIANVLGSLAGTQLRRLFALSAVTLAGGADGGTGLRCRAASRQGQGRRTGTCARQRYFSSHQRFADGRHGLTLADGSHVVLIGILPHQPVVENATRDGRGSP